MCVCLCVCVCVCGGPLNTRIDTAHLEHSRLPAGSIGCGRWPRDAGRTRGWSARGLYVGMHVCMSNAHTHSRLSHALPASHRTCVGPGFRDRNPPACSASCCGDPGEQCLSWIFSGPLGLSTGLLRQDERLAWFSGTSWSSASPRRSTDGDVNIPRTP